MIGATPKPRNKQADELLGKIVKLREHIVALLNADPHHPEVAVARGEILKLAKQGEKDISPDDFAEVRAATLEVLFKLAPARSASDPTNR